MKKLREEQAQAELESLRAEMAEKRAKKTKTSEHYTEHRNEQTPDRRAKAKAKTGPSPKRNTGTLPPVPPMPTKEKSIWKSR